MKLSNIFILLILTFVMGGTITSCKKDDNAPNNGVPRIRYVRVTNPESGDSLLTGAFQSNLIAIVGENLQGAREIWFNDQRAQLTPTYVTSTTILVSTPAPIPTVIDNKLKLIFADGDTLKYDFKILIKAPALNSMLSEYVAAGEVATIRGDFFYAPLKVVFEGGAEGEIVSIADQMLKVIVPDGAQPGQITVSSNFGTTKSNFFFRDPRNIFLSSDPFTGWWNVNFVVTNPIVADGDPPSINGNYVRIKQKVGAWAWTEVAGGPPNAMGAISKNIPDEAILKPSDYNLKFELNTKKPYNFSIVKLTIGVDNDGDIYQWAPPYDTKGQWETVVIPFEEVVASYTKKLTVQPDGYWFRLLLQGPGDLDADMSFDNFRLVPKVIKE